MTAIKKPGQYLQPAYHAKSGIVEGALLYQDTTPSCAGSGSLYHKTWGESIRGRIIYQDGSSLNAEYSLIDFEKATGVNIAELVSEYRIQQGV